MSKFLKVVGKAILEAYNDKLNEEISQGEFDLICKGFGVIFGGRGHDEYYALSKEIKQKERQKAIIDKVLESL